MMETTRKPNAFHRIFATRGMGQVITVTVGLIVLCGIFGLMNGNFLSERNIPNLLRQIAPFLLVGIGQSYVLITGNIDLSIGSVLGMSCMISATLMTSGVDPWVASVIAIISCLVAGILNGILVAKCKIPPFIATLGTMTICRGIAQLVNNNLNTDSIGPGAQVFRDVFYYGKNFNFGGKFLGIFPFEAVIKIPNESFWSFLHYFNVYNTVIIVIVLWLIFFYILSKTRFGRYIYAVGSNIEATKLSGVNVPTTIIKAYVVSAFCAGITGLIQCAQGGLGTMDAGMSYEMYAVASSVIGGVSTLGGQGILLGTIVGACVWGAMQNGLSIAGAPVAFRNIIIGIIVVLAVLADVVVRSGKRPVRKKNKGSSGVIMS